METVQHNNREFDLEKLVKGLKKEDARYLELTSIFKWIMWIFAPIYFLMFLFGLIFEKMEIGKIVFLFFSFGFLSFALLFRSLHIEYKSIDYGVSTLEMLRKAANRYELWQLKTYLAIIPVLLIAIGFGFSAEKFFPFPDQNVRILVAFCSILVITCCSFVIGYFIWRILQKPLRDKALSLLSEIQNG